MLAGEIEKPRGARAVDRLRARLPAPGRARLVDVDLEATLGELVRGGQPSDPAADHDYLGHARAKPLALVYVRPGCSLRRSRSKSKMAAKTAPASPKTAGTQPPTRGSLAVSALAIAAKPAVSPSASRRPTRRTVSSRDAARKFTSSFWPGRAPMSRSRASRMRAARTFSFCD